MHKAHVLAVVALLGTSCVPPQVNLEAKKCDPSGACVQGYACVEGACLHLGAAGTPCSGASPCDRSLTCVSGTCAAVPNGGCIAGQTRPCGSDVGTCTPGAQACLSDGGWGACDGGVGPVPETCDGQDNDCDGVADNAGEDGGFACALDSDGGPCTSTCGSSGNRVCKNDCSGFTCVAPAEVCNGKDDDCDGVADNGFACVQGSRDGGACSSCNGPGVLTCKDDCSGYACRGPAEVCNGLDDDCDGVVDNGFACAKGADGGSCITSCGSVGRNVCKDDCSGFVCTPPAEVCNGKDDDCDGVADNGFACAEGADAGACPLSCGAMGYFACNASCSGPSSTCTAPPERCNGVDDDCACALPDGTACTPDPADAGACNCVDEGLIQPGAYDIPGVGGSPQPAVAAGPDGGVLVYVDSSSGAGKVMVQPLGAENVFAGSLFAAHASAAAQSNPQAALAPGGALVGWIEAGTVQIEPIGDHGPGTPFLATPSGTQVTGWSMASPPNGQPAWLAWTGADGGLYAARVEGGRVGSPVTLSTAPAAEPSVAVGADGEAAVAYVSSSNVEVAYLASDGGLASVNLLRTNADQPAAAWTPAGLLVAYVSGSKIQSALLVNGSNVGSGTQFPGARAPHLAGSPDGAAMAFSSQELLADGGASWRLAVARVDASGIEPGNAKISPPLSTLQPALQPFVAFDGASYIAAWSGGGTDLYEQRLCP